MAITKIITATIKNAITFIDSSFNYFIIIEWALFLLLKANFSFVVTTKIIIVANFINLNWGKFITNYFAQDQQINQVVTFFIITSQLDYNRD